MVLPPSGVSPDPCHKSGNIIILPRRDFLRVPTVFSLRTQALSQSLETEGRAHFAAASITSPQRASLRRSEHHFAGANRMANGQNSRNDRILSNFTKNRRQSGPEGTAEEMLHRHVGCPVHATRRYSDTATRTRKEDGQRAKTAKNNRILSNFTKKRPQSSPEGTAESHTCPN